MKEDKEIIGLTPYLVLLFQFLALFTLIVGEYSCYIFYTFLAIFCLITYVLGVLKLNEKRGE